MTEYDDTTISDTRPRKKWEREMRILPIDDDNKMGYKYIISTNLIPVGQ